MNKTDVMAFQQEYVLGTYAPSVLITKGQGSYVWDADGKKYLDFTTGISVCNLGHCHPAVTEAIQRQAATLVHTSNLYMNEWQPQLAALIAKNSLNGRLFFANSGAEANEGMIKFARMWGNAKGKNEIICMEGSFHGRTLATLAATARPKYREGFQPDMAGFSFVPFNDLNALKAAVTEKTAAILLEPIQGEGGITPASQEFIAGARQLCDQHDMLLLFDEVQCGIGRTGRLFAYQQYGVEPDAMSMAKALGNGYPIGAFQVQRKHESVLPVGKHASTFGGTPLACAAAHAVISTILQEDLLLNCQKMGEHFKGALIQMASNYSFIKEVRGMGLMIGVELDRPVADAVRAAAQQGLLILNAGENVLRFLPPLNLNQSDLDQAIKIIDNILGGLA